jgi:hypothetical protein
MTTSPAIAGSPYPEAPDETLMSRFLAKVAVECLALKLRERDDEIVSEHALDPLRDYARRGPSIPLWPFHSRMLYPPDFAFSRAGQESYEVLHEWIFAGLGGERLYFVLGLFGVEYTLNLGEREIESYLTWLQTNSDRSPLSPDGIESA